MRNYSVYATKTMWLSIRDLLVIMEHIPKDDPLYERVKYLAETALEAQGESN